MLAALSIGDLGTVAPGAWFWLQAAWQGFAQGAGTTLVNSIWQSAVIVCGLEFALRLMPRVSAAHRFVVWAAGFGVAFGLPFLPMIHFGSSAVASAGGGISAQSHALLQIDARWGFAIAGLWVVASVIRGTDLLVHSLRLRQLWKTANPVAVSEDLKPALKNLRRGGVRICTTDRLDHPSVIGFLAPRILIPNWLFGRLTTGELDQIVLHEAEHLRRRDDWTNLVQKLAMVAFPLNPGLAWMEHQLCREREMACDEGVVRITNAPRAYAACLASLAERGLERRTEALSLGAWHKRSELVQRVHGILRRKRGMSRKAAIALLTAVGCALVGATVEMARAPELVAFVPQPKELAMTPARQQQMAALLAQETRDSKIALPSGYRAVSAKAILPEVHRANRVNAAKQSGPTTSKHQDARATTSATQIANADISGDRAIDGTGQQWIVLSAWEEVQTVSTAAGPDQISDYDTHATVPSAAQGNGNMAATGQDGSTSRAQAGTRYTVTQLILRVVPAKRASNSTQPPAAMVQGGWFVIQL